MKKLYLAFAGNHIISESEQLSSRWLNDLASDNDYSLEDITIYEVAAKLKPKASAELMERFHTDAHPMAQGEVEEALEEAFGASWDDVDDEDDIPEECSDDVEYFDSGKDLYGNIPKLEDGVTICIRDWSSERYWSFVRAVRDYGHGVFLPQFPNDVENLGYFTFRNANWCAADKNAIEDWHNLVAAKEVEAFYGVSNDESFELKHNTLIKISDWSEDQYDHFVSLVKSAGHHVYHPNYHQDTTEYGWLIFHEYEDDEPYWVAYNNSHPYSDSYPEVDWNDVAAWYGRDS